MRVSHFTQGYARVLVGGGNLLLFSEHDRRLFHVLADTEEWCLDGDDPATLGCLMDLASTAWQTPLHLKFEWLGYCTVVAPNGKVVGAGASYASALLAALKRASAG